MTDSQLAAFRYVATLTGPGVRAHVEVLRRTLGLLVDEVDALRAQNARLRAQLHLRTVD